MTTPGEHRVRKKGKVINQKNVRLIKFIALERLYEKVCIRVASIVAHHDELLTQLRYI